MKDWRSAASQGWGLAKTTTLIGRRTVANCSMNTESPKPRTTWGWHAQAIAMTSVLNTTGHGLGPTFFWGGKVRQGGRSNTAIRLIPMGDWRDLVRSQTREKTGATR